MPTIYDRHAAEQYARLAMVAADGVRPADDISVSEWCEGNLELSDRQTNRPGLIRLDPHQRRALDALKNWHRVVLVWAAQVGKTVIAKCFMGWAIAQRPGHMGIVYPDRDKAAAKSAEDYQPLIEDSPALAKQKTDDRHDFQRLRYHLKTMTITMAWAGSASKLSSDSWLYLIREECAKYPDNLRKEARSFLLAERRTMSFGKDRRILDISTPTVEEDDAWQGLLGGTYEERYIKCPHCGQGELPYDSETGERNRGWQVMFFEQFRYPARLKQGEDVEPLAAWQRRIRRETYFECADCQGKITELMRWKLCRKAEWYPRNPDADWVSQWLPSWYGRAETCSFGNVAARYVEALEYPDNMHDWMNSDAALPYQPIADNAHEELILAHCDPDYKRGTVPIDEPCLLIMIADPHQRVHFWTVWAITARMTYLVDCGKTTVLGELEEMRREAVYETIGGQTRGIDAGFFDSGYRPDDIYDMAVRDPKIYPVTGKCSSGLTRWTEQKEYADPERKLRHPVWVLNCNDEMFKERLLLQFESGLSDEGEFDLKETTWILPKNTPAEFRRHMLSEKKKVTTNARGREVVEWEQTGPNHYFDNAKYLLAVRVELRHQLKELLESPPEAPRSEKRVVYGEKPEGWDNV